MNNMYSAGICLWLTGLSGAGKTTTAQSLSIALKQRGILHDVFDGDEIRTHLSKGLGFSSEDRFENIRRVSWVTSRAVRFGGVVIVSCISPYKAMREEARSIIENEGKFIEIFIDTPLEVCEERDIKGLYARARAGEIECFTGISDPYEVPDSPELRLETVSPSVEANTSCVMNFLEREGYLKPQSRRALFVGRWQPFHKGHDFIIRKKLNEGVPVAVGVRDTPLSVSDPYTLAQRVEMIREIYRNEDVLVFACPDIESINIGRKVGYEINRYDIPEDIGGISATEIRNLITSNDDSWKTRVPESAINVIERMKFSYEYPQ